MNTYLKLMRYELKNITRDQLTLTMMIYPLIMVIFGAYLIPLILEQFDPGAAILSASLIILIVLASLAPMLAGAILGFLLLDHKDENTLDSLRVTPVSLTHYLRFKAGYTYLLSVLSSVVILIGVKTLSGEAYAYAGVNIWDDIMALDIVIFSLVSALFAPVFGLIIATLGANKIEGFAYLKSLGILILIPALVTLDAMQGWAQYSLGIIPTFWPVKALLEGADILPHEANLNALSYTLIGTVYMAVLIAAFIRRFVRSVSR